MDRYLEEASTFFTRLAYDLGGKWHRNTVPLSRTLGSPAPQTSLIFELPDELILSILSHISPDPQLTGHYSRFRVQYSMRINDYYDQRTRFLRSLSMTCRAMRLRFLPWVWERVKCLRLVPRWYSGGGFPGEFNAIAGALRADIFLAASVRFMTVCLMWGDSVLPLFVRCLESLPNLHTLEIGRVHGFIESPLKNALERAKLPQIKTLILPPSAYPLLPHCCDVEDVVCVVGRKTISSDEFLDSLASNQNSKVKRLAIPLVSHGNQSRYVAAFSRLTELTLIYPHPYDYPIMETGIQFHTVEIVRSATSELVNACGTLPEFDTLQIVHYLLGKPTHGDRTMEYSSVPCSDQRKRELRERVKGVKDLAVDSLEKAKAGCLEGERRKTMLRVIELSPSLSLAGDYLDSVKVEVFEV